MDKLNAKQWYIGVTHVLTSYVTAGIFSFVIVFFAGLTLVALSFDTETAKTYISLLSSLVILPFFLFPATMYSIKFITDRYVITKREAVIRYALISIAVLKIVIDWVFLSPFSISGIISFLLSIAVFYGVSVKWLENNEFRDSVNLKDVVMK